MEYLMPTDAVRKDDPNVKIPASVLAAAARADELHKATYKKDEPAEPPKDPAEADPKPPTDAAPKELPPADPKPDETPVTQKSNDTAAPKDQNWEHAYKSMKGRHDQAISTVRSLNDRIGQLEGMIASLQVTAPPTTPKPADTDPAAFITPEEVKDYGEDFLNVVAKKAKQVVGNDVASLRAQLDELKQKFGSVGQTVAKDARERMKDTLNQTIPNWAQVNVDSNFFDWLALQDPYSGAIRHNLLKDAWSRNDAARVGSFFKGFLAEQATGTPTSQQPDQTPSLTGGKVPLEALAAPGRAKTAADTGSPAEKPIITRAQIAAFYADRAAKRYLGREKEADALEQQIFAAQREGRIR